MPVWAHLRAAGGHACTGARVGTRACPRRGGLCRLYMSAGTVPEGGDCAEKKKHEEEGLYDFCVWGAHGRRPPLLHGSAAGCRP